MKILSHGVLEVIVKDEIDYKLFSVKVIVKNYIFEGVYEEDIFYKWILWMKIDPKYINDIQNFLKKQKIKYIIGEYTKKVINNPYLLSIDKKYLIIQNLPKIEDNIQG